ncbi:hypothetical protein COO60DRAFT_1489045 [Scenedesmus sp. NREL 46B-D3]|nr:hypothetical protein COO60DRAFT_1489045 [Scenedesmus sp. NREL 46B-D3]
MGAVRQPACSSWTVGAACCRCPACRAAACCLRSRCWRWLKQQSHSSEVWPSLQAFLVAHRVAKLGGHACCALRKTTSCHAATACCGRSVAVHSWHMFTHVGMTAPWAGPWFGCVSAGVLCRAPRLGCAARLYIVIEMFCNSAGMLGSVVRVNGAAQLSPTTP